LAAAFAKLSDSTGQPLRIPDYLSGIQRLATNLPDGRVFVGDWTQMLIGVRTDLRFARVLDQRYADELAVAFLAYIHCDVALAHPEAFAVAPAA